MSTHSLEDILHPRSIAVAGASSTPDSYGYNYTHHLLDHGYRGKIYPVNPKYPEILGLKTYPSVRDIPEPVDYVISCLSAAAAPSLLDDCSQKGVKAVHLFAGRLSETGHREDAELEQEILKKARKSGVRIIGPNCMGVYYPREGISFDYDFPKEPGSVGIASQSGGGIGFFIHISSLRGVRFSKVISYGNALDLTECDYLDYFARDPETKIILMYVEGVKDGRRFFNSLRQAASTKPVVILKGGRGKSGSRAAASHTASLAGSTQVWESLVAQAGAIFARDFDELADIAVSLYFLPRLPGLRVGINGGGGGPSVLAADVSEEAGLEVIPLPMGVREELKSLGNPMWDWIGNPADFSILGGSITSPELLRIMAKDENFDFLINIVNEDAPYTKELIAQRRIEDIKGFIKVKEETSKPILVVAGEKSLGIESHDDIRWKGMSEARTKFIAANMPIYPTTLRAARAARKLVDYYQRKSSSTL